MPTKKTASAKATRTAGKKKPTKTAKKKSTPSTKQRTSPRSSSKTKKKAKASDKEVTIDRRRTSRRTEKAEAETPVEAPKIERRKKVQRRRQIDPTTCERDYTDAEVQFMNAMDDYKRKSGRMFPTCSEVLEVIRGLGYVQLSSAGRAMLEQCQLLESEPTNGGEGDAEATFADEGDDEFADGESGGLEEHRSEPVGSAF